MRRTPEKAIKIEATTSRESGVLRRSSENPYVQKVAVAYIVVKSVVLSPEQSGKRQKSVSLQRKETSTTHPVNGTAIYQHIEGLRICRWGRNSVIRDSLVFKTWSTHRDMSAVNFKTTASTFWCTALASSASTTS